MNEVFETVKFSDIDINDSFFDSLKSDYDGFNQWFKKKQMIGALAYTLKIDGNLSAFLYLKDGEKEAIPLNNKMLPLTSRIKIGTFKIDEKIGGKRLGEGAIGLALWHWFRENESEIYVTTFSKQKSLINLFEKFGFTIVGEKADDGELVLVKDKNNLDFSDPYKSFPYINPNFNYAGILTVDAQYHDQLFPYSELQGTKFKHEVITDIAGNGITKMYVSGAYSGGYSEGEPILIYRKSSGTNRGYKSVVTSIGTVTSCINVKSNGTLLMDVASVKEILGNKSVLSDNDLLSLMDKDNVSIYKIIYNHYLGTGNNINWHTLHDNGMWEDYPTSIHYSNEQFKNFVRDFLKNDMIKLLDR